MAVHHILADLNKPQKIQMAAHPGAMIEVNPRVSDGDSPCRNDPSEPQRFIWQFTPSDWPRWIPKSSDGSSPCQNDLDEFQIVHMTIYPIKMIWVNSKKFTWQFIQMQWPGWNLKIEICGDYLLLIESRLSFVCGSFSTHGCSSISQHLTYKFVSQGLLTTT